MLLAINITPTFSMLTMAENLFEIFMLLSSWIMSTISSTATDKATQSASELYNVKLHCTFNGQDTGTPKAYKMNLLMFLLLTETSA